MADFRDYLIHYGIPQTRDGKGSGRYRKDFSASGRKVFVSGSSKTQDKGSKYYRRKLPKAVSKQLDEKMRNGDTILVGDAPGIDRQVQDYLKKKKYDNVEVYGPGKEARYIANKDWKVNLVDDPDHEPMSPEWLAKKDKAMSDAADEGIAVILEQGSKATRKNVARLMDDAKDVSVYQLNRASKFLDKWLDKNGKIDIQYIEKNRDVTDEHFKKINSIYDKYLDKIYNTTTNKSVKNRIKEMRSDEEESWRIMESIARSVHQNRIGEDSDLISGIVFNAELATKPEDSKFRAQKEKLAKQYAEAIGKNKR